MGGAAQKAGKLINPTNIGRGLIDAGSMGTSEIFQKHPFGVINNPTGLGMIDGLGLSSNQNNPYISGPFSLDPYQMANDKAGINSLADSQFGETNAFNTADQATRASGRDKLAQLLTQQATNSFQSMLPNIAENAQAAHLYDSTGYGQEVARQQAQLSSGIANQLGQVGLQDINRSSDLGLGALQAKQGMNQSALSRGFSLEDFVNQANVAKQIGAAAAPQVGNGKGATGALLTGAGAAASGIGSLGKLGKAAAPAAAAVA